MQKSFQSLLWCISFVLVLFTSGFAQDSKLENGNGRSQFTATGEKIGLPVFNIDGTSALLWDNFLTQSTTAIVSGQWGGLPVGANQVIDAEDFFVPSATTWTIDQIAATGFYTVGESNSWGVAFYADNAGVPGALIQAVTVPVVAGNPNPAGFLSSPVVLNGGGAGTKYWVSIYGINNTATTLAQFRWNWYASEDPEILSEPYLRDDAVFFGGTAGWVTYTSLGLPEFNALMFQLFGTPSGGCPVVPASDPLPANGSTGVSINPGNATWTNGAGTTQVEVFFGPVGNVVSVYSGTPITSLAIPSPLQYATTYNWRVVCKNDTCSAAAVTWSFTTEQDPNLVNLFFDDFEAGSGLWTLIDNNPSLLCPAKVGPRRTGYTLPGTGNILAFDSDECGSTAPTGLDATAEITASLNASLYQTVTIEFDNDWQAIGATDFGYIEVSTDGGANWTIVKTYDVVDVRNTHEFIDISTAVALTNFKLRLRSVQPGWNWWWVVDNIKVVGSNVVPVELVSFAATTDNRNVTLNWSTATELNNSGFQVERSNGSAYEVVGFVAGHGTTSEIRNYSFVDQNVLSGSYSYRLKQVDFDGTFEYSNVIEVEVVGVKEFALGQNYPNPFNPSTTISFSLAVDSKVSLKIFDVLGQEVATLLNGQLAAGSQTVSFDASSINSGVYFYRIDASGVDGQKFSSTKKMILTK